RWRARTHLRRMAGSFGWACAEERNPLPTSPCKQGEEQNVVRPFLLAGEEQSAAHPFRQVEKRAERRARLPASKPSITAPNSLPCGAGEGWGGGALRHGFISNRTGPLILTRIHPGTNRRSVKHSLPSRIHRSQLPRRDFS